MKKTILHLAAAALAVQAVSAVQIGSSSISYTYDKAQDSSKFFNYTDQTGKQLVDGALGVFDHTANLGNGAAYEWVGWNASDSLVNIDFTFDQSYNFNEVKVGTLQNGVNSLVLPDLELSYWNGATWTVLDSISNPESAANNGLHLLSLNGFLLNTDALRLTLSHNLDGPWTFLDEVQFFAQNGITQPGTNVPEAASTGVLLGLSALGLGMIKRKR